MNNITRKLITKIDTALADTPVVVINGPRQSGKTTLARQYQHNRTFYSLDDDNTINAIKSDPVGFINRIDYAVIDEIQRAPELLRAIKLSVDQHRKPGRFLLTGSANLLSIPQIGDSLAGRMEVLTLLPFSLAEMQQRDYRFLDYLLTQDWPRQMPVQSTDYASFVLSGGYPEMQERTSFDRRLVWARSYIKSITERDVRDISAIEKLVEMPKLLEILGQHAGNLINFTQIGGQIGLDTKTVQKYVALLENLFLVKRLYPWHKNTLNRMVKTPKLHFIDSGLLAALNKITPGQIQKNNTLIGPLLETWVFTEILKSIAVSEMPWDIYFYRDKDKYEVDFVLENYEGKVIGIEVKASATVFNHDFNGLNKLSQLLAKRWHCGIVLYGGTEVLPFGQNLWAVPLAYLD